MVGSGAASLGLLLNDRRVGLNILKDVFVSVGCADFPDILCAPRKMSSQISLFYDEVKT